jgi:hypothetical protein
MASSTASFTITPVTSANLDSVLAVVSAAAYRDDASLVSTLETNGLTQLDLTGSGTGTFVAANAAFDAWTTVVNDEPAAIIAFRGTDDINYSLGGLSAYENSTDATYWLDTTGYYDLLDKGVAAFDAAVSALGIHEVYVTGHSLGGAAAQAYMAAHPDTSDTSYTAVVFGSLGLSGDGSWSTDGRITAFADASDVTNLLGTQTAGLTVTVQTGSTSAASSGLDLSALLTDPASFLTTHSISLFADDAARYDAAKAGIPSTDVTTFITATASYNGLPLAVSSPS